MRPALTPAQQYLFLRANVNCAGKGSFTPTGLRWRYYVQPTPLSREYLVEIIFDRGEPPKAFVKEPNLSSLAGGRDLPHIYRNPDRLCLCLPKAREWTDTMRIDQTFVPWIATWLFYFEEWLGSDVWKGGGEHPEPGATESYNRHVRRAIR